MIWRSAIEVLPQMNHLVAKGTLGFAGCRTGAEASRDHDLERGRREMAIAATHTPAQIQWDLRELTCEVPGVHTIELDPETLEVGLISLEGAPPTRLHGKRRQRRQILPDRPACGLALPGSSSREQPPHRLQHQIWGGGKHQVQAQRLPIFAE